MLAARVFHRAVGFLFLFGMFFAGAWALYLLKQAAGINFIPGWSLLK